MKRIGSIHRRERALQYRYLVMRVGLRLPQLIEEAVEPVLLGAAKLLHKRQNRLHAYHRRHLEMYHVNIIAVAHPPRTRINRQSRLQRSDITRSPAPKHPSARTSRPG